VAQIAGSAEPALALDSLSENNQHAWADKEIRFTHIHIFGSQSRRMVMKCFLAAVCIVVTSAHGAYAQQSGLDPTAGRKITSRVYQTYSAHAYRASAICHARAIKHSSTEGGVPKDVAEEHAAEIRRNVTAASKNLFKLEVITKDDKAATALIAEIKAHEAAALKACNIMEVECAKNYVDHAAVSMCCTNMVAELTAAEEAHTKLMQHLKLPIPWHAPHTTK